MAYTSQSSHRAAALLASAVAALGLLTACGSGNDSASTPQKVSGTAAPATGGSDSASDGTTDTGTGKATDASSGTSSSGTSTAKTGSTGGSTSGGTGTKTATSTRCHTSELKASVGGNDPGAGQENFPLVLTNTSGRTCTVRGYPGAAFTDSAGKQLGPDPKRSSGTPTTVTLKPGQSAWAGLTFSNPEISGAATATPSTLVVTPPDELDPLKVAWSGGKVPVSGNSSSVFLTVLSPGTGP
ncbi:DUF4232 domain-containing protein [Streptomyces mangrovisoli]|uniref:DUF4232 domain-containing protein n=1 Tax=Streptomyces mangrovisoli TaxID=1428628 RepID=A0A1J4P2W5_9ACTN|nr:DUF4232 domain-containing protein [Streptomyces mangrovisoli]OIJ68912.1 hypothetical protein WN71_005485 [Streptomyces mangrovisoli]